MGFWNSGSHIGDSEELGFWVIMPYSSIARHFICRIEGQAKQDTVRNRRQAFLLGSLFDYEYRGDMFLWNVRLSLCYMLLQLRGLCGLCVACFATRGRNIKTKWGTGTITRQVPASFPPLRERWSEWILSSLLFFLFSLTVTFLAFPHHVEVVIKGKELSISK